MILSRIAKDAAEGDPTPEAISKLQSFLQEAFDGDPEKLSRAEELLADLLSGLAPGQSADKELPRPGGKFSADAHGYTRAMDFARSRMSRDDAEQLDGLLKSWIDHGGTGIDPRLAGDRMAFDRMIDGQVRRVVQESQAQRARNTAERWPEMSRIGRGGF